MNDENKTVDLNKINYIIVALVIIGVLGVAGFVLTQNKKLDDTNKTNSVENSAMATDLQNESENKIATEQTNEDQMRAIVEDSGMNEVITNDSMMNDENVVTINVTGESFKFLPSTTTVKKGQTIKINFESTGGFHDFVIDEFNAKTTQINTGGTTSVEFIADKLGSFEYYCSVANHRAQGMVGKFVVTE